MAFQKANGLVADGIVGAHTIERLDKACAAQSAAARARTPSAATNRRGSRSATAINLDASTAKIAWTTSGATAACHTGTQFALLHCTKGANLTRRRPLARRQGEAVRRGRARRQRVYIDATANEFDIGDRQIGMVQTTELMFYEFVYAGRRDSRGLLQPRPQGRLHHQSLARRAVGPRTDDRRQDLRFRDAARPTASPHRKPAST